MIGAIIGDVVGSRFERSNYKGRDFDLFSENCRVTDDSIMTFAVAEALLRSNGFFSDAGICAILSMQEWGCYYPDAGYGRRFSAWLRDMNPQPYGSWGNGAAMRVSPCAYVADNVDEVKRISRMVTGVTHNHAEGMKGAEAVAVAVFMARTGCSKEEIRETVLRDYYSIDFTLDEIRETYAFDVSCQGSVPQALQAFFEASDFESAIRNAVSIGGDSDTIAAITGSIAAPYFGVPAEIREKTMGYLDIRQKKLLAAFDKRFMSPKLTVADSTAPRYTPDCITRLEPDEIFVFGSNLAGAHGGGAARVAMSHFGAVWGQGVGLHGQSYAIPTMQGGVETIAPYVDEFIAFARSHPELRFLVTRIGCGIAGFRDADIAPLFRAALTVKNITLPESFHRVLT